MSAESLVLERPTPIETERLLAAAAFGAIIEVVDPTPQESSFQSILLDGENGPLDGEYHFNSILLGENKFNSILG